MCVGCKGAKCFNPPTTLEPLEIDDDNGETITLTQCPKRWCGDEVAQFVAVADMYRRGLPPVAGGQLDQAQSFLLGFSYWLNERDRYRDGLSAIFEDGI